MARALATLNCWPQTTRARPLKPAGVRRISKGPACLATGRSSGLRRSKARSWRASTSDVVNRSVLERAMPSPILRFAPSPNGHLHLGHAYSALFTDFWANRLGGTFLLRLEDTDITRCRPEFAD